LIFEKPKLFNTIRELLLVMMLLALIVIGRLGWEYRGYRSFVSQPFVYVHATILSTYPKTRHGKTYAVIKLRSQAGRTIYTTAYRKDLLRGERLYLQLSPGRQITFWNYLGGMYCKSKIKKVEPPLSDIRSRLERWVGYQHNTPMMRSFYNGIFWASPIPKTLREPIAGLGVSHLVALSGFHLGILWGMIYGGLLLIYRKLQQRHFPWRHALLDVGSATVVILSFYLWLTGFPPSLLRSFVMLLLGWGMVLMGIELISFSFLFTITMLLLALAPSLIASLGFWLSVLGVFYIFLLLTYCQNASKKLVTLVCIPVGIFILMQPLVHGVFGVTSLWQLLSPLLSIGFIVFYPLVMVLHLFGVGGALDGGLTYLFSLPVVSEEHLMPAWVVAVYLAMSLGAIWRREVFWILGLTATIYGLYLFV